MSLESCIDDFNALCLEDQWQVVDILAWFVGLSEDEQDAVLKEVREFDQSTTEVYHVNQ